MRVRAHNVIDATSWHGRVYLLTLAMMDSFIGQSSESHRYYHKRYSDYYGSKTSFCHYWRMIMVYSWLVPTCYVGTAALALYAGVIFPLRSFGWFGPFWLVAIPVGIAAVVVVIFFTFAGAAKGLNFIGAAFNEDVKVYASGKASGEGLTFFEVILGRLLSFKYGVCPEISIDRSKMKETA